MNNISTAESMLHSLHDNGIRLTRTRALIIKALCKYNGHFTADELYLRLSKSPYPVSRATIYRNLRIMAEQGLISVISVGKDLKKRFSKKTDSHSYLVCRMCGEVKEVKLNPETVKEELQDMTDYELLPSQVSIVGLCPKCSKAITDDKGNK